MVRPQPREGSAVSAPNPPEPVQSAESVVVWRSDVEVVLRQFTHTSGRLALAVIRLEAALEAEHSDGADNA